MCAGAMSIASPRDPGLFRLAHSVPNVPFTTRWARKHGLAPHVLTRLVEQGVLRRMLRGVYVDALVPDTTDLRIRAIALVAPPGSVVCDWTACWVWTGLDSPGSHLVVPRPAIFRFRGQDRTRHGGVRSGERWFLPSDVLPIADGLFITTPIRTAWDMGRFAHRYVAIGAMDALMRFDGFSLDELVHGVPRFAKQRGVVQLRELAFVVDPRSESIGESAVRLHWLEIPGAPTPVPQVPVLIGGRELRLDLGVEEIKYAAEYDGETFHSEDEDRDHDRARRAAIEDVHGWTIDVLRKVHVFGQQANVKSILSSGIARAESGEDAN